MFTITKLKEKGLFKQVFKEAEACADAYMKAQQLVKNLNAKSKHIEYECNEEDVLEDYTFQDYLEDVTMCGVIHEFLPDDVDKFIDDVKCFFNDIDDVKADLTLLHSYCENQIAHRNIIQSCFKLDPYYTSLFVEERIRFKEVEQFRKNVKQLFKANASEKMIDCELDNMCNAFYRLADAKHALGEHVDTEYKNCLEVGDADNER